MKFSSPQNYNGQVTLLYEEQIDINKINEDYELIKNQLNEKSTSYYSTKASDELN